MSKVLITGGCGFIGSHFVEHFLKATDWIPSSQKNGKRRNKK